MHFSHRHAIGALLLGCLTLSACGGWRDARVNPRNWFGSSETVAVAAPEKNANPLIPVEEDRAKIRVGRQDENTDAPAFPITEIVDLRIDRTASGAFVVATGVAKRQCAYDAKLVSVKDAAGSTLIYTFEVSYPEAPTYAGNTATRTIRAAVHLSNQELRNVRKIRVEGETNARETRR